MPSTPRLVALTVADEPSTWSTLGFRVTDGVTRIGSTEIHFAGPGAGRGIVSWDIAGLPPEQGAIDGIPISTDRIVDPTGHETPADIQGAHSNLVCGIDHVVVSTPDVERTVGTLESLGLECRRRREGAAYGSQTMRQAFFWLGDPDAADQRVVLEVVGPETVDPSQSDHPATFFGLALVSSNLDATAQFFGAHMNPPVDAVQHGRRIATLSSKAGSSVALAFMTPHS